MHLLEVNNLHTCYIMRTGITMAVDGVSFTIDEGELLGMVGESGCGKTTVVHSIVKLLPSSAKITEGEIVYRGEDLVKKPEQEMRSYIRWKQISLVPQAVMNAFNPLTRIGDQIVEAIEAHEEIARRNAWEKVDQLFRSVGLDFTRAKSYPHELSGGMKQRAMIAMALACSPELMIADEPATALDVITQAQIIRLLIELQRRRGLSVMIITHDLSVVAQLCNRIAIMYAGKIVESGDILNIFREPLHPYTQALIKSFPNIKNAEASLGTPILGSPPDLRQPPAGCRFHPRCIFATDVCKEKEPELQTYKKRLIACHMVS